MLFLPDLETIYTTNILVYEIQEILILAMVTLVQKSNFNLQLNEYSFKIFLSCYLKLLINFLY